MIFFPKFLYDDLIYFPYFAIILYTTERVNMLGYTQEQVENMAMILNYSIHHHIKDTKFAFEDTVVLRQIEDLLLGLLAEGRV
jgi:hypothetical protein